jgi:hypothetical protein
MATATTRPNAKNPQQPPDERFWVKYSPHHELPISSMTSLAWHVLVGVLIVVVGFIVAHSRSGDMPIETIEIAGGGGGGDPNGVGTASGAVSPGARVEAANEPQTAKSPTKPAEEAADPSNLKVQSKDPLKDIVDDEDAQRELAKIVDQSNDSLQKLARLDKKFREGLLGTPGQGQGGPGSRGGKGDGTGTGVGSGEGSGKINARTKRQLRWTITFKTSGGSDYLRQLNLLGAILAFRHPDGEIKVVRDLLGRPLKMGGENLKQLNRIFWIDDNRDSVEQLATALGLNFVPDQIVALFPHDFEKALADKEKAFANRTEDQIKATKFLVLFRGKHYEIVVTQQY